MTNRILKFAPVYVSLSGGVSQELSGVVEAAYWLMDSWPDQISRPNSFQSVTDLCIEALRGSAAADAVRRALIDILAEAGMLDPRTQR